MSIIACLDSYVPLKITWAKMSLCASKCYRILSKLSKDQNFTFLILQSHRPSVKVLTVNSLEVVHKHSASVQIGLDKNHTERSEENPCDTIALQFICIGNNVTLLPVSSEINPTRKKYWDEKSAWCSRKNRICPTNSSKPYISIYLYVARSNIRFRIELLCCQVIMFPVRMTFIFSYIEKYQKATMTNY